MEEFFLGVFALAFIIMVGMARTEGPLVEQSDSHWAQRIDGLEATASQVYKAIEEAVAEHKMPNVVIKRIKWKVGGVLSGKREYLRVRWGDLLYDICVAPFGTGVFISSWGAQEPPRPIQVALAIPGGRLLVGIYRHLFDPITYYKVDSASMFQSAVQSSLMKVIDHFMSEQGLAPLGEPERRPMMREIYGPVPARR